MYKKLYSSIILLISIVFTENNLCELPVNNFRSFYSIGDTISIEDQSHPYQICYSSEEVTADTFRLADFNGNLNGGDYKIILISMNAAW